MIARRVRFSGEIEDEGWGLITHFEMPGDLTVLLYEPRYEKGS